MFFTSKNLHFDISQLNITKDFCHELHLQGTDTLTVVSGVASSDFWVHTLVLSANNHISIFASAACEFLTIKRYGNVFKANLTVNQEIFARTICFDNIDLNKTSSIDLCSWTETLICINSSITLNKLTKRLKWIKKQASQIKFKVMPKKQLHPDFGFIFNKDISINVHERQLLLQANEVVFNQVHSDKLPQSLSYIIFNHARFIHCRITSKYPIFSYGFTVTKSVLKLPISIIHKKNLTKISCFSPWQKSLA